MPYETFDHTADIGIRVRAADLNALFAEAARGLFATIVANLDGVLPLQEISFHVSADRLDDLLFDWLAELLYTFDTRRLVFSEFHAEVAETGLSATARGEPMDRSRHEMDREVKAITYHGLKVERKGDGWTAEFIADI